METLEAAMPGCGLVTLPKARGSAAIEGAASEGSDALMATAVIGGAVLALALLAGLGLRRLLRDT